MCFLAKSYWSPSCVPDLDKGFVLFKLLTPQANDISGSENHLLTVKAVSLSLTHTHKLTGIYTTSITSEHIKRLHWLADSFCRAATFFDASVMESFNRPRRFWNVWKVSCQDRNGWVMAKKQRANIGCGHISSLKWLQSDSFAFMQHIDTLIYSGLWGHRNAIFSNQIWVTYRLEQELLSRIYSTRTKMKGLRRHTHPTHRSLTFRTKRHAKLEANTHN